MERTKEAVRIREVAAMDVRLTMRCALGTIQPVKIDADQIKREGWLEQGILVVSATDARLNWIEQEQIKQIGEKLYGRHAHR